MNVIISREIHIYVIDMYPFYYVMCDMINFIITVINYYYIIDFIAIII